MWSHLPLRPRLYAVIGLAVIVGYIVASIKHGSLFPPMDKALVNILVSAPIVALVGLIIGTMRWSWSLFGMLGGKNWFPDLNGVWQGPLNSTYTDNTDASGTVIIMRIDQRWTKLHVSTESADGYMTSETVTASPRIEDGKPVLWLNFKATVPDALPTDEKMFYGSSRLVYDSSNDTIRGMHWTNRASQQGLNTSGSFELSRISNNPEEGI